MQKWSWTSLSQTNLIGIDYGTKKSGIAYSVSGFSFWLKTVPTRELLSYIREIIEKKQSSAIIIGMPYNIDGTMSQHGRRVEQWKKNHENMITIPIIFHDERLTSSMAHMSIIEDGIDSDVDTEAARLILQSFIEESGK